MRTVAVVLAGGTGRRFGASVPKQLQALGGISLIEHCVTAFDLAPGVHEVLVVSPAEFASQIRDDLTTVGKLADVIPGGASRTESTRRALGWLNARLASEPDRDCNVLFHDAARPLIDQQTIADCISALDKWLAIGVVVPTADTIVEVAGDTFRRILPRDSLARCQTPQGFRLSVITRAYQLADGDPAFATIPATDDCGVVLRYLPDVPVGAVPGSERNLKITYADDLAIAEALLPPREADI
jgi:ribitol-5-phosphate 2-dehydrogenase (NADP+) / D-ribitol-5-phosphate cytidylyltransferase